MLLVICHVVVAHFWNFAPILNLLICLSLFVSNLKSLVQIQIQLVQIGSNQIKLDQIGLCTYVESNQIKSNKIGSNQIKSDQIRSIALTPSPILTSSSLIIGKLGFVTEVAQYFVHSRLQQIKEAMPRKLGLSLVYACIGWTYSSLFIWNCSCSNSISHFLPYHKKIHRLVVQIQVPCACHYKPRLVYFLLHFVRPFLCFQGVFFRTFCLMYG
jgi:hypothetical protein